MIARAHRRQRRVAPRIRVLLALAALALVSVPAPAAHAHASLRGSDPADGSVVDAAPEAITLYFNEPVRPVAEAMRLVDRGGGEHPIDATAVDHDVVATPLDDLDEGQYTLSWRVISADSHPVSGVIAFAVGTGQAPPPEAERAASESAEDRTALAAVRTFHYLGLLVFAGLLFFTILIARESRPPRPRHRLLRASGAAAILAGFAAVPATALAVAGLPWRRVADSGTWVPAVQSGPLLVAVLTAVGVAAAYWCFTGGRGPRSERAALGAAAVAVSSPVLAGHSMVFEPRWLVIGADLLHLFTAALWTGGLIGLIVLLRHARGRDGFADAVGPATVVARFSAWAGGTVALLGLTGLAMALAIHRDLAAFVSADHGKALLVKLGLVAAAVALAAANRFRLVPIIRDTARRRSGLRLLHRILLAEASIVVLAVAAAAVLVDQDPGGADATEATIAEETVALGEGEVRLTLTPASTGINTVTLRLTDAAGHPLEPLEAPEIYAALPEEDFGPVVAATDPAPGGGYRTELDLPLPGRWELHLHVRVSRYEHVMTTVPVDVR